MSKRKGRSRRRRVIIIINEMKNFHWLEFHPFIFIFISLLLLLLLLHVCVWMKNGKRRAIKSINKQRFLSFIHICALKYDLYQFFQLLHDFSYYANTLLYNNYKNKIYLKLSQFNKCWFMKKSIVWFSVCFPINLTNIN